MEFDEVQIGQSFLYRDIYMEGWIVTGKTKEHITTVYMLNYGGEFSTETVKYSRDEWARYDYFDAYVKALRSSGMNISVEEVDKKEARL